MKFALSGDVAKFWAEIGGTGKTLADSHLLSWGSALFGFGFLGRMVVTDEILAGSLWGRGIGVEIGWPGNRFLTVAARFYSWGRGIQADGERLFRPERSIPTVVVTGVGKYRR